MLPFLDDQEAGAHLEDLVGCRDQGMTSCQLAGFFIIDAQDIATFDDPLQLLHGDVHPKIHGVQNDQFRPCVQLIQDAGLDRRSQVAQHEVGAILITLWQNGLEMLEHIQFGDQGVTGIKVIMVFP